MIQVLLKEMEELQWWASDEECEVGAGSRGGNGEIGGAACREYENNAAAIGGPQSWSRNERKKPVQLNG